MKDKQGTKNTKKARKLTRKTTSKVKPLYLVLITISTFLLIVILAGSFTALLFPDETLVFLKNKVPEVFTFFVESEEPEIDKSDWVEVEEEEFITPEDQNSGEVKTTYEQHQTVLSIPAVDVTIPIVEGESEDAMLRGAWHFPKSAPINTGGNTVIFGHRFHKVPPAKDTFYSLDKVKVGDQISITNKGGSVYKYSVVESKVIDKNDRSILDPTSNELLTLITCTPLWTSEKRLVVTAKRV